MFFLPGCAYVSSGAFVLKVQTGSQITEIPCVPDLVAN